MNTRTIKTDVLVVGGGGAGFRAAIGAREKGLDVTLLSKGPLARCGATPMAGADFTLDGRSMSEIKGLTGDPNDSPEKVFNDIVTQGCYLNDQKLVQQYIEKAPQCLRELIDWGIQIKLSDERMIFTSGIGIMDALLKKAKAAGVLLMEDVALLDLTTHDGAVVGGLGLIICSGEFILFKAKAVIMATGGWHKAFWPNTGMRDLSGEGIAMALRAGAELGNMEFITFCCNVFYHPSIWRGSLAPYILSLMVGGKLTNRLGEEFLNGYDPMLVQIGTLTEWNKSFISHATAKEVRSGKGSIRNGIYYSRGDVPWEKVELVASIVFPKWKYKAIDLKEWGRKLHSNEPVEVGPAVEYFEGGIRIDSSFQSSLPGLFAAGECTRGVFGANRVFAAITEMLVHGADAGEAAAAYAMRTSFVEPNSPMVESMQALAEAPLGKAHGEKPAAARRQIQEAAHKYLGPIRTHKELVALLEMLCKTRDELLPNLRVVSSRRTYNKEWLDAIELRNMIQLLEAAARSALSRCESRGVHFREDFPETDNDHWLQESVVHYKNEEIEVTHCPVNITTMTPPKGKVPYLDFIKHMMASRSDTGGKH
ncbi:MAG: FAD-binding protein [Deltaproteobacteria bacterium]|nr:FAD-binding protein [Deltaproteobacteria bacterium]